MATPLSDTRRWEASGSNGLSGRTQEMVWRTVGGRKYGTTLRKEGCSFYDGKEVSCLSPEGCGTDYECFRKERNDFFKEVKRLAKEREANERKMDDNP